MDELIFKTLDRYFNVLSKLGYFNYKDVDKMLFLIAIYDFIYNDFEGLITEDDYRDIEKAVYCILGSTCLIPFPSYCKNYKSMDKLHLKDITYLTNKIKKFQEQLEAAEETIQSVEIDVDKVKRANVIKSLPPKEKEIDDIEFN